MGLRLHDFREGHRTPMITVWRQYQLGKYHPWLLNGITQVAFRELVNIGKSSRHTSSDFMVLHPTHWKGTLSVCVCV